MFLFLSITLPTNQNFSLPPLKKKKTLSPFLYSFNFFCPFTFYLHTSRSPQSTFPQLLSFLFLSLLSRPEFSFFLLLHFFLFYFIFLFLSSSLLQIKKVGVTEGWGFFFFEELANGWGNTSTLVLRANCLFVYCAEE